MQLIISLNIFYFFLISYHAVHLNNNINYIDGICFHNDVILITYLDYDTYYIYNCSIKEVLDTSLIVEHALCACCSIKKQNYLNICLSNRYMEKESKCYICNLKNNYIYVQINYCNFDEIINNIFFNIMCVIIINLILIILKKNQNQNQNIVLSNKKNIKVLSYNKININKENDICSICLSNFEDKYDFIIKTNCIPVNHFFCYSCSKLWFNNNSKCPNCRQIIKEFL